MPHEIDIKVGQKIREFRHLRGLSQTQLADQIGVRFQQLQKYESAANRVSASRLMDIATALDFPVAQFFPQGEGDPEGLHFDLETAKFYRSFQRLNKDQRATIRNLIDTMVPPE